MPDVDERLDSVEQKLKDLGERIDERFAQVDERFAQVDQRFAQVDQRFDRVEQRIDSLAVDVQKLRVLGEEDTARIKLVAEVQGHHGETLQRLDDAVQPLITLQPLFEKVVKDHEDRITALERARP